MIDAQFTYFDLAVLGVMGLSCLFAFFRGFVREILSLGAWIGAGIVTLYWFREVAELIKPHVKSDMVSGGLSALGLYIISLIIFSLFNSMIMKMMKEGGDIGILDNTLGLMFGAFRGAFIVSLAYFLMMIFVDEEAAPDWLKNAHTRPYAEKGAIILGKAAPEYLTEMSKIKGKIEGQDGLLKQAKNLFPAGEEVDEVDLQRTQDERSFDRIISNTENE